MISLLIPPKDQIAPVSKKIADELGTATNIKSRVTRQSVITALTSVQARLKLYNRVPTNGLVIYCGEIMTEDGKEKKVGKSFDVHTQIIQRTAKKNRDYYNKYSCTMIHGYSFFFVSEHMLIKLNYGKSLSIPTPSPIKYNIFFRHFYTLQSLDNSIKYWIFPDNLFKN